MSTRRAGAIRRRADHLALVRRLLLDIHAQITRARKLLQTTGSIQIGRTRRESYENGFTRGWVAGYDAGVRDYHAQMMNDGRVA